jgi:hypothetical protein
VKEVASRRSRIFMFSAFFDSALRTAISQFGISGSGLGLEAMLRDALRERLERVVWYSPA